MPTQLKIRSAIRRLLWGDASMTEFAHDVASAFGSVEDFVNELRADVDAGGSGAVSSVFARTGAIVATLNDYAASLIDNDSGVSGSTVADALDALATLIAGTSVNQWSADAKPVSPNAADREFTTNGAAIGLTTFDPGTALSGGTLAVAEGTLRLITAGGAGSQNKTVFLYNAVPGSEFAVYSKLIMDGPLNANYRSIGLALGNAGVATNATPRVTLLEHADVNAVQPFIAVRTYSATAIVSTEVAATQNGATVWNPIYQRLLVNGANATFWDSVDGRYWRRFGGTIALPFTPSFVGVGMFTSTTAVVSAGCDWLRYFTGAGSSVPGANNIGRYLV